MKQASRREFVAVLAGIVAALRGGGANAAGTQDFIDKAFEMKRLAESTGDEGYGAIVVRNNEVVGLGPSRVVVKKDWTAHAEREAIRDAQGKLGRGDLSDCVMYSTSRPCGACESVAAQAKLSRMYYGPQGADAGAPKLP